MFEVVHIITLELTDIYHCEIFWASPRYVMVRSLDKPQDNCDDIYRWQLNIAGVLARRLVSLLTLILLSAVRLFTLLN